MADLNHKGFALKLGRGLDWVLVGLAALVSLGFILMIRDLPFRAVIFPCFITVLILVNACIYSFHKLRKPSIWDSSYDPDQRQDADIGPYFVLSRKARIIKAFIAFFCLSAMSFLLGQLYAIPIFVTTYLLLQRENKILAFASGAVLWGIIQFIFIDLMSLNLPIGYLLDLL